MCLIMAVSENYLIWPVFAFSPLSDDYCSM